VDLRLLAHSVITPKQPGWMDEVNKAIEIYKPDSWKSYTIRDPLEVPVAARRRAADVSVLRESDEGALRRLEIPEDMQKKYAFAPLGDANSTTKQLIFAGNAIRLYKIRLKAADKNEYALAAEEPSNLRYGYVRAA
jgi:hypothetical protein